MAGSVGVIYLRPVLEQLLSKVGVDFSSYKSGGFKDMTRSWLSPTDRESAKFQELINEIFDNFLAVVAEGRSLDEPKVREIASGEIMTAQKGIGRGWWTRLLISKTHLRQPPNPEDENQRHVGYTLAAA